LVTASLIALAALAQDPAPPPDPSYPPSDSAALLSPDQLDQLLGPVALYPDPLLSELLPAATLPSQIVLADRFLAQGGQAAEIDSQAWDPCIQAIAHYPDLLKWMDDNLPWTTQVGQAFVNQQQDVMDSIQRLRGKAQVLGNLPNTPQETVVDNEGEIDIEPTQPDQIYLPYYQPDQIYDDSGIYCSFGIGWPIGGWLVYDWDWRHHHIVQWGPHHPRPDNWWHRSPSQRVGFLARGAVPAWHPPGRGFATHPADRGWTIDLHGSARGDHPIERPVSPAPIHVGGERVNLGVDNRPRGEVRPPVERGAQFNQRAPVESHPPVQNHPPVENRPPVQNRAPIVSRPPEISRPIETRPPVVESRPAFTPPAVNSRAPEPRGFSTPGVFGGPQSSVEARQSSERGMESRGGGSSGGSSGAGGGSRRR
jgi:uncharacterized membrane protein YgcG